MVERVNMAVRLDHKIISRVVEEGSTVLDLGCGNGELLNRLYKIKNAQVQGIELDEEAILSCVEKGVSVFHSDIESWIVDYPDNSFDYVILNQSMQEVDKVDFVIDQALRVGREVIVGFPNFAYISSRLRLFFCGKVPITKSLPYRWYNTPNLHFLSILDFCDYCSDKKITISKKHFLGKRKQVKFWPNLFALNAVFVITR